MDIDHIKPEEMEPTKERILSKRDELGLLMLEKSARGEGYHLVFRRREGLSQEENLRWASELLGVEFDHGAKDITRVFFTTTADPQDLIFLDDEIFRTQPPSRPTTLPLPAREGSGHLQDGNSLTPNPSPVGEGRRESSFSWYGVWNKDNLSRQIFSAQGLCKAEPQGNDTGGASNVESPSYFTRFPFQTPTPHRRLHSRFHLSEEEAGD
jgi:hypothetical protein